MSSLAQKTHGARNNSHPDLGNRPLGFLGGTFDPVHMGHLLAAQDACELMNLDRLYFIPAAQNPLKSQTPLAPAEDRLAMLELVIASNPRFGLLDIEISSGDTSYTVDTVETLRDEFAGHSLYWVIGTDQVSDLPRWHRIAELARMVEFICIERPGYKLPASLGISGLRLYPLTGHLKDADSSGIRERLGKGLPVDLLLPPEVSRYISKKKLYK